VTSNTARVLQFPRAKPVAALSPEAAARLAKVYFETDSAERAELDGSVLNPDFLCAATRFLQDLVDSSPKQVADEARRIYRKLSDSEAPIGFFDERDYFLGETALLTGKAMRNLGELAEAENWIIRSEAAFRHIINASPCLANVAYARLAIRYEMRRYQEVVEHSPALIKSFERLGMLPEAAKGRFLFAAALKQSGDRVAANQVLGQLEESLSASKSYALLGQVFVEQGELLAEEGQLNEAGVKFRLAIPLLKAANRAAALANLKVVFGYTLRQQGKFAEALTAMREAAADFADLSMKTFVAYVRILIAETLLSVGRGREAEWEIRTALPIVESERLVPEGFAACLLLKESLERRDPDRGALTTLRERLQNS
jgi:tetratricopeptide (TPR) repeat protein